MVPPTAPPTHQDIAKAASHWERQLAWLSKGWDCLEEYQIDLSYREDLEILLEQSGKPEALPETLRQWIAAVDDRFRGITVESRVCVWHIAPQYRYVDGQVTFCLEECDPKKYWFFYRWLAGHPYSIHVHDCLSYQKAICGLDFRNMSRQELIDAALVQITRPIEPP